MSHANIIVLHFYFSNKLNALFIRTKRIVVLLYYKICKKNILRLEVYVPPRKFKITTHNFCYYV